MSDPALLSIYRETTWSVDAPGGAVQVRPADLAPPALRPSAIVTAYNPASRLRERAANQRADERLLGRIRALGAEPWRTLAHGTGEDAEAWDEPGWCLPGDTRETAVALGHELGQNAILWIDAAGRVWNVCTREGFCGARVGETIG
jgi:hypothetical protein